MSTKIHFRKTQQIRLGKEVHHKLRYFAYDQDLTMSRCLDFLVLFAFDIIASRGIGVYMDFIKKQRKLNEITKINNKKTDL